MEDPPPTAAWPSSNPAAPVGPPVAQPAPTPAPADPTPNPASRYLALQVISILLIFGGLAGVLASAFLGGGLVGGNDDPVPSSSALVLGLVMLVSLVAVVSGAVMSAVRALVVRASLPATRYRGPPILVLLLLVVVVTTVGVFGALGDLIALESGGDISIGGSLLLLTITQAALLVIAGIFVVAPRALDGIRLLPPRRGVRTLLLGLLLAIPAWMVANALSLLMTFILGLFGREPQAGIVDNAIAEVDPTVLVLAIVLVAPVAEEVFFRGIVYNAWLREHGPRMAIFGSAALFAVIHANTLSADALIASVVTVVPILFLGIALALLYRRTGSLPAAIGLHAGFNGITVTLALLVRLGVLDIPLTP